MLAEFLFFCVLPAAASLVMRSGILERPKRREPPPPQTVRDPDPPNPEEWFETSHCKCTAVLRVSAKNLWNEDGWFGEPRAWYCRCPHCQQSVRVFPPIYVSHFVLETRKDYTLRDLKE